MTHGFTGVNVLFLACVVCMQAQPQKTKMTNTAIVFDSGLTTELSVSASYIRALEDRITAQDAVIAAHNTKAGAALLTSSGAQSPDLTENTVLEVEVGRRLGSLHFKGES